MMSPAIQWMLLRRAQDAKENHNLEGALTIVLTLLRNLLPPEP